MMPCAAVTDPAAPQGEVPTVTIVGCGSIGTAFAVLFARAGFDVRAWDALPGAFERARTDLDGRLGLLDGHGLLLEPASVISARVSFHPELPDAVLGAALVQECAPEDIALKRSLFEKLSEHSGTKTVLASSSSALVPSSFAADLGARSRVIVGHPGNPPYLLPVIEVVPASFTDPATVARAAALYRRAGLKVIQVRHEVEGFVFNRLQGALLREAYCLVRDGIASVEDIDEVVRSGLGRRWSVLGPFETVDLNTRGGIASHALKMGPAYERMGAERGQHDPWTPDLVEEVARQRRAALPLEEWEERVRWRDEQLMRLEGFFQERPLVGSGDF
jgi:3-hydroxyacyl-CoA dehydrogenase